MTQPDPSARFFRSGLVTLAAVYFLILVGGAVRASGAGLGCPDWPTCFGLLIPPTDEAQLPPNWRELYPLYQDLPFNWVKTWTEYVNRLVGATIGLLVTWTLVRSLPFRKMEPRIFYQSLAVFLMVGFQAWLGSKVVASDLRPVIITAHMVMAFLIVVLLIHTVCRSRAEALRRIDIGAISPRLRTVLMVAMAMTLLQVAMGTQIREAVDGITNADFVPSRSIWREHFPIIFYVHRSFSSVILFTNLWLAWNLIRRLGPGHLLRGFAYVLTGLVVAAILTGVSLDRLGFPAFVQPVHLLLANLIFGCQFFLFLAVRYGREAAAAGIPDSSRMPAG